MRTLVLRIDESVAGGQPGYPVTMSFDDGEPGWGARPLATAVIPDPIPPLPIAVGGESEVADQIRSLIVTERRSARFVEIGRYLHDLVVRDDVKVAWDRLRGIYPREQGDQEGIRAILDVQAARLRSLPWELMSRQEVRLSTQQGNCFVRGSGIDFGYRNEGQLVPLRILVVVGCRVDEVEAAEEVDAIRDTVPTFGGRVDLEVLTGPSRHQLVEKYLAFRPHVFHFIGHGDLHNDVPVIRLCDSAGQVWLLSRSDVGNDLGGWVGQLVILNACRTTNTKVQEGILSLAEAFTELGYPAVIGMQGDIVSSAAVAFAGSFYEAVAKNQPIDRALVEARRAVYLREGSDLEQRDWALPIVTLKVPPDQVLQLRFGIAPQLVAEIEDEVEFRKIRAFVDRAPQRRNLTGRLDPDDKANPPARLTLITGSSEIGKSWLVLWCLRMCALRGQSVSYVNLSSTMRLNYLDVLRKFARAKSFPSRSRPDNAFASFNDDLNTLLRPDDYRDPILPGVDANFPLRAGAENLEEAIFSSFRHAVATSVAGQPLVAIDDLETVLPEHLEDYLWPRLFRYASTEQLGGLRLILVLNIERVRSRWVDDAMRAYPPVNVTDITRDELLSNVREFLVHQGYKPADFAPALRSIHNCMKAPTWRPRELEHVAGILNLLGIQPV